MGRSRLHLCDAQVRKARRVNDQVKLQYGEAVRLYLWYKGSKFSWHKGKTSKELAERYRRLSHEILANADSGPQTTS